MKDYKITGKTKCFAIIGDPVEQALSPIINNGGFNSVGADAVMVGLRVQKENIEKALDGVRALNISGLSVTMPLKSAVIPYLDDVEEKIKYLGAVNVVTNHDGILKGYNTDGDGFVLSMKAKGVDPRGKSMLVFGAGGAAKGICYAFLEAGVSSLTICNRSEENAKAVIDHLKQKFSTPIFYTSSDSPDFADICCRSGIILNATSMGMKGIPAPFIEAIPWERLSKDTIICDVVNKPVETEFIKTGRAHSMTCFAGDGMTLYQATIVYKLFMETEDVPFDAMKAALEKHLEVING